MTQDKLLVALQPHLPTVANLIRAAAQEYESYGIPPERRLVVDGAPSGIMIYTLIWDHFVSHFGFDGPVRVSESDGLKVLLFEDPGVCVRVNKLDALNLSGPVSNTPGKFRAHPQLSFRFYEHPPGHLVFGYTTIPNEEGVCTLDRVVLTLESDVGVQWSTYIDESGDAAAPAKQTPDPTPPVVEPRVLPDESVGVKRESEAG